MLNSVSVPLESNQVRVAKEIRVPLLSVVVTSFNHESFIVSCLMSIWRQTYPNIEIVVIDNLSSDGSRQEIERFQSEVDCGECAGRSIKIIFSDVNLFLTGAMILGKESSRGPYIAFVDGDDFWLPHCAEAFIRAFLACRYPAGAACVNIMQCNLDQIVTVARRSWSDFIMDTSARPEIWKIQDETLYEWSVDLKVSDLYFADRSIGIRYPWSPTSAQCYRREMVDLMFLRQPLMKAGTDTYLIRAIAAISGSIVIDMPLVVYRFHGGNMYSSGPDILNISRQDKRVLKNYELQIATEIIALLLEYMDVFQDKLEWPDLYIEIVDITSRLGGGLERMGYTNYAAYFISENSVKIMGIFGKQCYTNWARRYHRPRDKVVSFKLFVTKLMQKSSILSRLFI